ncbi:HTH-type transcriptional repressor yvoA, partial [Dysosmobacter welbionis]
SGGISSTAASSSAPTAKAPSRNLLFQKARVKSTGRPDLQLKPWNRRLRHRVAKAMVLATAAPPLARPMWKAMMVARAITRPSVPTLNRKGFVRIPSLRGRGFSCITASLWGSRPRAMAGRE